MERNPQAAQMADESMVRNLAAQAEAIWPQERVFLARHRLPVGAEILDVGCGTGEISVRLAIELPRATVLGVDLEEPHLALARARARPYADRVRFQVADAFELPFAAGSFDLVVCRHLLQAVPHPERVLAELVRVCRPGGALHLIPEDYGMIYAAPARLDVQAFWYAAPRAYAATSGTDLFVGRHAHHLLRQLPVDDVQIDYVHVDTQRVERATFAAIFEAWRDGYSAALAGALGWPQDEVRAHFDATIECIRDPDRYALWLVPIVSARRR